jgi:thiol-disulfide isomerase/thioredoxin
MTRFPAVSLACMVLGCALVAGARPGFTEGGTEVKKLPAEWFWGRPEQRQQQDLMVGQKGPELKLSSWMNGEVKPEQMKGKIVVLDFWATWCGPCLAAIPHTNEIAKKYKDQGVVVVGICGSNSGQDTMAEVAQARSIQYPIAKDATQETAKAWKVMWWPTFAIIDRTGTVRGVGIQTPKVEDAIKAILAEQPAPKA